MQALAINATYFFLKVCRLESPFEFGDCVSYMIGTRLEDAEPCFELPRFDVSATRGGDA